MAVKNYAHIDSDGNIMNVSLLDVEANPDWKPDDGMTLVVDEDTNEVRAEIGGRWTGAVFELPVILAPSRMAVLMNEGPATQMDNPETYERIDRPADDIAADRAELLGLLHAKLSDTGDLTWEQMNKMLALERET